MLAVTLFIIKSTNNWKKAKISSKINGPKLWAYTKYLSVLFLGILAIFVPIAGYIEIGFISYIFYLYLIIVIFCIMFLELNFASLKASDSWLTIAVIIGMSVAILIVGYSLPLSFLKVKEDTIYSYIFYYYSAIIQLFGTILSIAAMITVHHLQRSKMGGLKEEIVNKLKSFMLLYISVIIISLGGLALGKIPPLDISLKIASMTTSGSIFCFVTTMLLIIPALAALFSLACWLMDLDSREDDGSLHDFSLH